VGPSTECQCVLRGPGWPGVAAPADSGAQDVRKNFRPVLAVQPPATLSHSQHSVNSPIRPHEKSKRCYQSELVQRVPITLCSIGAAPYCSESNLSPSPVTGEQQGLPLMNGDGLGPQLNCDPETRPDTQPGIIIFHTNNFN